MKFSKIIKGIISVTLALTLAAGGTAFAAGVGGESGSMSPPPGYVPQEAPLFTPFIGLMMMAAVADESAVSVLLVEDVIPWGSYGYISYLQGLGSLEKCGSADLAHRDLSGYDLIVISNDQLTSTYNNLNNVYAKLEQYAYNGGVILFGAADRGWNGGYMPSDYLPGGVMRYRNFETDNRITDHSHDIVTGALTDGVALKDSDLHWGYASHTSFEESSFPAGSRAILREAAFGSPTLAEVPVGNGIILYSGLTWEHAREYGGQFGVVSIFDLYKYAAALASNTLRFDISSVIMDVTELEKYVEVQVAVRNVGNGIAGAELEFFFDNRGGHIKPVSVTGANGIDLLQTNVGAPGIDWSVTDSFTLIWGTERNITRDTEFVTIVFEISDDIEYNTAYALSLSGRVINEIYEDVDFTVKTGSIETSFITVVYGDAKYDGQVDIADVVRLLQYLSNMVELSRYERIAANTSWDSPSEEGKPGSKDPGAEVKLNIKDAMKIAMHLARLDVVLGSVDNLFVAGQ